MNRIPPDAFERYVAMGALRSYRTLANELDVSKRAVSKVAAKEGWSQRLAAIDAASRIRTDQRIAETLDEMRDRHLRSLKAVQGRALEALKRFSIGSAAEAVTALEKAIKLERLVAGEASERSELAVAEITKREIDTLLSTDEEDEDDQGEIEAAQAG